MSGKHVLLTSLLLFFGLGCGGGNSNPQNPSPTLSSLSPSSAIAGSNALTLTASGSGFVSASVIEWNGVATATTYVSSTSLTGQVPASDLSSTGTANVAVQNPAPGGGTSGTLTFTINPPPNPTPTITSLSPSSASVGSPAFTLTVTGTQFISNSQVMWNGTELATNYVSGTSLTAQIPASDLTSAGTTSVAVQNPPPGGGTSNSLSFTVNPVAGNLTVLDLEGSDLTWDPTQQKLYVAVPSAAATNPSTVTIVDPIAGSIVSSQSLSSAPYGLAISDNSQYLYTVINGGATIQRLILPALTPDIQWSLGTDKTSGNPNLAGDIKVQPGAPHTLAVSFGDYGSGWVAVFDDAVERSSVAGSFGSFLGNSLQWKADGSELYAANTSLMDNPYTSGYSNIGLYTMPVNANGVGTVTTYDATFRAEGAYLHSDPTTGYVYDDWGEVVNAANGTPIGNYRYSRPNETIFPGPLSVVDPNLQRFYTLFEISEPDGTQALQIQSFDQTQFNQLSTIVIPDVSGEPTHFIRWGQSGLAVVTNSIFTGVAPGKLYILDGSFVNPSGALDTSAGSPLNAVPTLTGLNPITATVGSGALSLTVTGRDFIGQPTVYWNGIALPTTLVSSTELTVQIPASNLTTATQATITASNTAVSFPASNPLPFSVDDPAPAGNAISVFSTGGNDLAWDPNAAKIYVSAPGVQGDAGDAIAIIDPAGGNVTSTGFLGSDPARISLSGDGQFAYVALYGANSVEQLTLPNFGVNASWNLGGEGTFSGPYYALDLQAAPGAPQTTAIVLANFGISPSPAAVVIYDGPTPRPTPLQVTQFPYSSLQWAGNFSTIYAVDQEEPQDFLVLGVNGSGAVLAQNDDGVVSPYSPTIHYDSGTGLVYTDGGEVIQPTNGTVVGSYAASGIAVPDSTINSVFILGQTAAQTGTQNYTIESFDQANFTAIGSMTIENVVGTPTALIRWGTNGLAFTTQVGSPVNFTGTGPGQLYVMSGNFVASAAARRHSSEPVRLAPVKRTWGLEVTPGHQPEQVRINASPFKY